MSVLSGPLPPLLLESRYEPRVWGSSRMGNGDESIGEVWGAYEGNRIAGGPLNGVTLAEACLRLGEQLLGENSVRRFGKRFPILTKLLDTNEWLSVQVHPDDDLAARLEGAGQMGKTEAWHLLETAPNAEIILGLQPGVDADCFADAARAGKTLDVIGRQPAVAGETWFIPAGTVHALGPDIFLYEVQQSSDITYRVYDWDRPASAGRELHLDQAIKCVDPSGGVRYPAARSSPGRPLELVRCPYFQLDRLDLGAGAAARLDTAGSFQALTPVIGAVKIRASAGSLRMETYDTAIIPASTGGYDVKADDAAVVMVASLPAS